MVVDELADGRGWTWTAAGRGSGAWQAGQGAGVVALVSIWVGGYAGALWRAAAEGGRRREARLTQFIACDRSRAPPIGPDPR